MIEKIEMIDFDLTFRLLKYKFDYFYNTLIF